MYVHRFLRVLVRLVLSRIFNTKPVNLPEINRAQGPFVLLSNHSAVIDPLILGMYVNKPIHFVVSDSQFRSPLLSWLLGLTGAIPKTKAVSDLDTVKKIVAAKANGGIIGIFPEGQSSWDGHQLPLVRATDKLIKSLKIPVYVGLIRGAYFSWPRWARRFRRGSIEVVYRRILTPEELRSLSLDQISTRIREALTTDARDHQQRTGVRYHAPGLAEYLERVLFICPACHSIGTLRSSGIRLGCTACTHTVAYTPEGTFRASGGREPHFTTIRQWNLWQLDFFRKWLTGQKNNSTDAPLLREPAVFLREGYKSLPLKDRGVVDVLLYRDRLETRSHTGEETRTFPLNAIEGINVQNNEHLEFYSGNSLYRLSTEDPRGNTYKWNFAVQYLQGRDPTEP